MTKQKITPILIIAFITGCAGVFGVGSPYSKKEHDLRVGNIPSSLHPEWKEADRCTKCHMIWSWKYGYYRGWDRHGFISDYSESSPFGYKDPYGLDVPANKFIDYYYTDWWDGPWLEAHNSPEPAMHFGGYSRVNDGTAKAEDFEEPVIVVDQSGQGDTRTIQEAVDKAQPGTTVFVRAGTYKESVILKTGICLWGENAHTTIINPDFTNSAIIAANNCDISGFTLTGTGMNYKDYTFSSGVHALDCDSTLVIRGNIFDSNAVFGVLVESSRAGGTPANPQERYINFDDALKNIEYTGYPNPRIIGNTFYVIGERAVFSIHAAPEIANNVFIGNVKTLGMTQHSRPFIHHNVFYRNNVTINMNRSMPVISHNIMLNNYWGQRIVEGALPFVHDNITWDSPYYKEFTEDGNFIPYHPHPGQGEREVDPKFVDPDAGNFSFAGNSPLASGSYGIVNSPGIQQPPVVVCKRSYAEEFNNRNNKSDTIVAAIKKQKELIRNLKVSYTIDYKSFMDVEYDKLGDQKSVNISKEPVSGMTYVVPLFIMSEGKRRKTYTSELFSSARSLSDSGTVVYDGEKLQVLSGRFKQYCTSFDDPYNTGEKIFRENTGGIYLDYDQYLNGSIGPMGTFFYGYLTLFGGKVFEKRENVDGHECVVIVYPNIGSDQEYKFYLDPELGFCPRRLEHYFERELYRKIDGYSYKSYNDIHVPVSATITDYAVKKPHIGKVVGSCSVKVNSISVNGD
ncbi:MAG: hypothetical protein HOC71_19045 [Candidatus Latescibacteria bacterium]|jgi:hypothetical protein|nr:hypothetical protein [Candidatus Latescibacterota bacterium]